MAQEKSRDEGSRGSGSPVESNFILPRKTNNAVKIVAPPSKTNRSPSSSASQKNNTTVSSNGTGSHASLRQASLFIPPRKLGKPKYIDEPPSKTTAHIVPDVTPEPGTIENEVATVSDVLPSQPSFQPQSSHRIVPFAPTQSPVHSSLDIYANNYIPMEQIAVNKAPATSICCSPLPSLDYAGYINSFAGYKVLSTRPTIEVPPNCKVPLRFNSPQSESYGEYLGDALQNEFVAQYEELESLSLYNVPFAIADVGQQLYRFTIPGLREHSPRVELGDFVRVRPLVYVLPGASVFEFQAIVWGISKPQEQIILRMDGFTPDVRQHCNLIFTIQERRCEPLRHSITRTAQLLNDVNDSSSAWLPRMLFPDEKDAKMQSMLSKGDFGLKWVDPQMNFEQQKAVDAVVTANYGCVPYLISGPPGTGKTKTIVETTLQLLKSENSVLTPHLLVCAPSDPAADTLATRLSKHLDPGRLFRLNGWTRSFAEVPDNLLPYTSVMNDLFTIPEFDTVMKYKVVVTTCRDAEMLVQARLTNEALAYLASKSLSAVAPKLFNSVHPSQLIHWTALLLDEAAQAIEPEVLIPLSVVDPGSSLVSAGAVAPEDSNHVPQVVMAGDEYQLGPRLCVKSASPLSRSLFARLFSRPLYNAHPLSRAKGSKPLTSAMLPMLRPPFTNLIRNYRSHPAILTMPSVLFYADTLTAECTTLSAFIRTWPGWKGATFSLGSRIASEANNTAGDGASSGNRFNSPVCWPVLFIDNPESDEVESILAGNGTGAGGLFNVSEARIAVNVVTSLLRHFIPSWATEDVEGGNATIQPEDVVVMSPFRAQVNHLRKSFREVGLHAVNIGPLEAFQGLESKIVVLCTTRTKMGTESQGRDRFVREDQARGLGVIDEGKRFNVAITRAKEGLIVIGNAECLTCTGDENWMELLAFCQRTDGLMRASSKTFVHPPTSNRKLQGRLERGLRYAEFLHHEETLKREGSEKVGGDEDVTEKQATGFGYPVLSRSGRNRLKGNMPSLEENMFREGVRIAEEMRDSFDADDVVDGAQPLPNTKEITESGSEGNPPMMPTVDDDDLALYGRKVADEHGNVLIDMAEIPSIGRGRGSGPHGPVRTTNTDLALDGMQFGSFRLPLPRDSGESNVSDRNSLSLDKNKGNEDSEDNENKDFDHDPEKEFERADCATQ